MSVKLPFALLLVALLARPAAAQDAPLVRVDRDRREVRVACEALRVDMPLEYFCVSVGGPDHETVLRTKARPAAVHAALLGLGIEPGQPLRNVEGTRTFLPPTGPPLRIEAEWTLDGRTTRERAGRLVRDIRTGEPMPNQPFVFVGSRFIPDGRYAADLTGQLVSLVNFESTTVDVPRLVSSDNATLEWEVNPDVAPPAGTPVTMVLTVIGEGSAATAPATRPAGDATTRAVVVTVTKGGDIEVEHEPVSLADLAEAVRRRAGDAANPPVQVSLNGDAPFATLEGIVARLKEAKLTNVTMTKADDRPSVPRADDADAGLRTLRQQWERTVLPQGAALRQAAQTHYEVMRAYQDEINKKLDEVEQLRREMDALQERYNELTTPQPVPATKPSDDPSD